MIIYDRRFGGQMDIKTILGSAGHKLTYPVALRSLQK
jgi:hypothetical protein